MPAPWPEPAATGERKRSNASRGIAPLTAIRPATRREALSSREPKRRVMPSATTSAGTWSDRGNSRGKSRMPRTSAPRNR